MPEPDEAIPEAAQRRLSSSAFSSGLSVPDFAACLQMGMMPVAFVQGFCAMQWGFYGSGSPYMRGMGMYSSSGTGGYVDQFMCPHGMVSAEHRTWGQNFEQTWIEQAWGQGFNTAFSRMLDEATQLGAHGVIGVIDTARHLGDVQITEFHITGTAVVVEGGPPPAGGRPWSTYLAGQRLAKLFEAGLMPVEVCASLASVRVWAYCITEYLLETSGMGLGMNYGNAAVQEIDQMSRAQMAARSLVRNGVRDSLGGDALHGAQLQFVRREVGAGDAVVECRLSGTRVRRFKDADRLAVPIVAVRLT
ncbi:MAG: heavy metal-binding domain-containing protein [Acidimicrobiales bacterium]